MNLLLVTFGAVFPLVVWGVAFVPKLKELRGSLLMLGLASFATAWMIHGAGPAIQWLGSAFALPIFIVSHWGSLSSGTKTLVLLVVGGFVVGSWLVFMAFKLFVWRSWFPDLVRVDERGNRTPYGRAYWWTRERVFFKWSGQWSAPWRFHVLKTSVPADRVSVFKLGVSAARFDHVDSFGWTAVGLAADDSAIPTTRVVVNDFRSWETEDLERKKDIAKEGSQGHLATQRQKLLLTRMDSTVLRAGRIGSKRNKAQTVPVKERQRSPLERVTLRAREGPMSIDGESSAPSSLDGDAE